MVFLKIFLVKLFVNRCIVVLINIICVSFDFSKMYIAHVLFFVIVLNETVKNCIHPRSYF